MVQKILRLLRNPLVQKVLAWAAPLVIGWVLSKLDKKADSSTSRSKKKK